jgi:hypothetical protein
LGAAVTLLVVAALTALSLSFLLLFPHYQQSRRQLRDLERERDALRQQVLSANQDAYLAKDRGVTVMAREEPAPEAEYVVPTSASPEPYAPPVRISSLSSRLTRNLLELGFVMVSQDHGRGNRGGFLIAVLENQDIMPPEFVSSPHVATNDAGFPQSYKEGVIFPRVVETLQFRRTVKLESADSYFTHVTVYLFSPRGGLIAKERFPLDRSVFHSDRVAGPAKPSKA